MAIGTGAFAVVVNAVTDVIAHARLGQKHKAEQSDPRPDPVMSIGTGLIANSSYPSSREGHFAAQQAELGYPFEAEYLGCRRHLLRPTELRPITPHPVHDH